MEFDNNQNKKSEQLEQISDDEISLVGGGKKVFGKIQSGKIIPCLVAYGAPAPKLSKKPMLMKYGGPSINNKTPVTILPEQDENSIADLVTGIEDTKKEQKTEE